MGTRGAIGFRLDGEDKVTYNHFDSYPTGLGVEVMNFLRRRKSDDRMKGQVRKLVLVNEQDDVDAELKAKILKKIEPDYSVNGGREGYYCILRKAQGHLGKFLDAGAMIDSSCFLLDSLFCEWAYIVNLDTGKLEIYQGFNTEPAVGRYGNILEDAPAHREAEYYGVALIAEIDIAKIRVLTIKEVRELCRQIEKSADADRYRDEYPEDYPDTIPPLKVVVAGYA